MYKQSARGVLYQIVFTSYGYVFISKETVEAFLLNLRHEGQI
jgi:hypothetical protein